MKLIHHLRPNNVNYVLIQYMGSQKILFTGPESSGKSTIARWASKQFQGTYVPEYARAYLQDLGRAYELGDLIEIACGQVSGEEQVLKESGRIFCDTSLLVHPYLDA